MEVQIRVRRDRRVSARAQQTKGGRGSVMKETHANAQKAKASTETERGKGGLLWANERNGRSNTPNRVGTSRAREVVLKRWKEFHLRAAARRTD